MKKIILVLICVVSINLLFSASLRVQDPQTWGSYDGKITEISIDVTPVGLYFQYEVYMTFAAEDNVYTETDSVEIIYNFSLPTDALITDSWLWVNDIPEKAYLLDVWTATSIYEGIVNRRKDPSILKKISPTNYSLNIYPMGGKSSRKVKITMMLPAEWQNNKVQSIFPNSLVNNLSLVPGNITINLQSSSYWQSPSLNPFEIKNANSFLISKDDYINYPITITYTNPSTDNTFFSVYNEGTDKYYQLIVAPFSTEITNSPKKLIFVFDKYYYSNTYEDVVDNLLTYTFNEIKKGSEINVFYDNSGTSQRLASNWLNSDDPALLKNLFTALKTKDFVQGNTLSLLEKAIDYNNSNGGDAQIILISNVMSYYQKSNLSTLVNSLYNKYTSVPTIDVIFYKTYDNDYYYYDYYYYQQDSYLSEIARRTKGNFKSLDYTSELSKYVDLMYFNQKSISTEYSFLTTTQKGFCYDQINMFNDNFGINSIEPIVQVGKFVGELPMTVELKYIENDSMIVKSYSFDESNSFESDSLLKKIWAGQVILENEWTSNHDNNDINEIINTSIENRVLSRYTAFLALEPEMIDLIEDLSVSPDGEVYPPYVTVGLDQLSDSSSIKIINNNKDFIEITVETENEEQISSFELIDILGKTVYKEETEDRNLKIEKSGLENGTYIIRIVTNNRIYSLKIII